MTDNRLVITESGFLAEFLNQHTQRTDRPFCFVLGAGASRSSGIPTGGELAQIWLKELYEAENFDGLDLDTWVTPERLGIKNFTIKDATNFYPQLYQRRYGDHEQAGYAFLESQMEGKEPSYGYSAAPNPDATERILKRALEALPDSIGLHRNYAAFLSRERKDFDRADEHFKRALNIEPPETFTLASYADFLETRRNDPVKADAYYRALRSCPDGESVVTRYASLLALRGEPDRAERWFKRGLTWYPDSIPSFRRVGGVLAHLSQGLCKG